MYDDDFDILGLVIKCFGITNISWQKFAEFPLLKLYQSVYGN